MKNKEIEELLKGMRDVSNTEGCSMNLDRYLVKLLLSYIEQLEKKVDQYENPEDLTLFYMWLDTKAKDKMKQLEKRNKQLYEGFMATQEELTDYAMENEQLEAEIKELNDSITWWTNRFNAVERDKRDYKTRIDKAIEILDIYGTYQYETADLLYKALRGDSDE